MTSERDPLGRRPVHGGTQPRWPSKKRAQIAEAGVTLRTRPTEFFCHTRSELRTRHRIRDFSHKAVQDSRLSVLGNAESV